MSKAEQFETLALLCEQVTGADRVVRLNREAV